MRLALLALLVGLAAALGSVAAQTRDSGETGTLEGRIIARIQDRTGDDGVDDYRIEFGFLPQWAMDDKDPWSEAASTFADWLPTSRYLTKARIDERAAADNRGWLRSSLITVPASATMAQSEEDGAGLDADGGDDANLVSGRVIARYQPNSAGGLRIEFGFLPEWAFEATANTAEAVQRYGANLLPSARFISAATLAERRDVWLRSSIVRAPASEPAPALAVNITSLELAFEQAEVVDNIQIGTIEGATAESDPISVTGTPPGLTIEATAAGENRRRLELYGEVEQDAAARAYTVQITARPPRGDAVTSTLEIQIDVGMREQRLSWSGYSPNAGPPGGAVTLIVPTVETGPANPQWTYASDTPDICTVNSTSGALTLVERGACRVTATSAAADAYRAGTVQAEVTVGSKTAPTLSWAGYSPAEATVGETPPRLLSPTATVDGQTVPLTYTYRVERVSSRFCEVDRSSGRLTALAAGVCQIAATSGETDQYLSVEASATVRILADKQEPELLWFGYDNGDPVVGGDAILPNRPGASARVGPLSYRSDTPSLCSVDSRTGSLTISEVGVCRVTVISAETEDLLEGTETVLIVSNAKPAPSPCLLRYPDSVDADASVNADLNCGEGVATYRSDTPSICSVNSNGAVTGIADGQCQITANIAESSIYREATTSAFLTVNDAAADAPVINSISCTPAIPQINDDVTCRALLSGGTPNTYAWSNPREGLTGSNVPFFTLFRSAGDFTISLTVSNGGGSDTESITVTVPEAERAPELDDISCTPSAPEVGDTITCTADAYGGDVTTWAWSGGSSSGDSAIYRTSFSTPGQKTISLTVHNAAGSDTLSLKLTVWQAPVINSITCTPTSPQVNDVIVCRARTGGGDVTTWSWSGGGSNADSPAGEDWAYRTYFDSAGDKTFSLTVSNAAGSDTDSITVTVSTERSSGFPPTIHSITCTPSSPQVNDSVTCRASISGGTPDTYAWSNPGEGLTGSNTMFFTRFRSTGDFTVSLTASNRDGSDTETITVTVPPAPDAPVINSISCVPQPHAEPLGKVTCTARVGGGEVTSWSWSGGDSTWSWSGEPSGNTSPTYRITFNTVGNKTVTLTVTNRSGNDIDSTTVRVINPPLAAPIVHSLSCDPLTVEVGGSVGCGGTYGGGAPATQSWSDSEGGSATYSGPGYRSYDTTFSSAGSKTITLTLTNASGSSTGSATITVTEPVQLRAPVIDSISCTPTTPTVNQDVTCRATLSAGTPTTYAWSNPREGLTGSNIPFFTLFRSAGDFTISLTVTNSGGSDTETIAVIVE